MKRHLEPYDPLLSQKEAAKYLGVSPRTLRRLNVARHPMPGTARTRPRFGHRLSVLNDYLAALKDPPRALALTSSRT